ncbi:accessory gene regulator B family protein [Paenibacillus sp.]|uniref:accessory gene regulator B family protein n=1 Tax=Paenibacillus sp. TaxID=58172 RepID=UPI0028111E3E|nr:accessory gene regulator B family protein [Paenibacillus sp.]
MIAKLSNGIAKFIRENNEQAASMEVLVFSTIIVLNTVLVTFTVLVVAAFTGRLGEAAAMLFSYVLLRFFSGGMHLHTSKHCNTVSIGLFIVLLHLPIPYNDVGFYLNLVAVALVAWYAPTKDIMHLNKLGPKYTIHFKLIALMIVTANFWIASPILSLAFLAQALSLTPPAYKGAALLKGGELK